MVGNGIRPEAVLAQQGKPLTKRLLCSGCGDFATFSRDGRTEVFEDGETEDLVLRNTSTGQNTKLRVVPETAGAESPVLSPDGKQIVYTLYPGKGETLDIVANHPGAKARVLIDDPAYSDYEAAAWFADSKSVLAYVQKAHGTYQIARVAVADGAVTLLKSVGRRGEGLSLSTDGRYIAYSAAPADPGKTNPGIPKDLYIYVMAADGSQETEIVKSAGQNLFPVWTPDGRHILFTSDRSGKTDLWSIPVQNGKAAGPELLVSADIGNIQISGIYGGTLYYRTYHRGDFIHIADLDSKEKGSPVSFVGVAPSWSPDGKSIAFKRHLAGSSDQYTLVIRSVETGFERTYSTTLGTAGDGVAVWFHDGKSVMTGVRRSDGTAFYRIDVSRGEFKELPGPGPAPSAVSPDDKTRYVVRRQPDGKMPDRILAVDIETGKESQIFESRDAAPLSIGLSPDGRTLVLGWLDRPPIITTGTSKLHIARVSVDGSGYRELYAVDDLRGGFTMAWTRDGRSVLFNQEQPGTSHWAVMRIPAEGGKAEKLAAGSSQPFDLSPDGSRLVYGAADSEIQLWTLDNVLPLLK